MSRRPAAPLARATAELAGGADLLEGQTEGSSQTAVPELRAEVAFLQEQLRRAQEESARLRKEVDLRRQAETALVTAEARLRLVMQTANIGFWHWDVQTNTVYHSPEWKKQLGYEDHEITDAIGEWQSRIHPEDAPRVQAVLEEFVKQPRSEYDLEFRLRHRDGSYRWIHSQGLLLLDPEGKPSRMLGVHVDITTAKNREIELRESEQRFRRLVETTQIIPWEADPTNWRFSYVGPRSANILGYPLQDWFGENFWVNHLYPDDRALAVEFRLQRSRRCHDYESEYRMVAADGRIVWLHDVVHVVHAGKGTERLQGFLVDITERKMAEEEHARLAAIVESSNDAIIGETLEGIITSWNKSAERIYGYSAQEAVGQSVRMFVPRDRTHEIADILDRMKRGEMVEHLETLRIRKDGKQIHVSLVVSPIRDVAGHIVGASAIARDITERKQLEAEVLQISEREQQRIAQDLHDGLGQLLSGTVHLITVLQLELAEQALPEAAEALRITELLNQAVSQTRSLARGLYPVSPEANGLMVALQDLALRTQEVFKVHCSFQCRQPVLVRDNAVATHLYRIAQEAITNALKHGKASHMTLVLAATAQRIVLTVKDNGCGFPADAPTRKGMGIRIMQYRAGMMGGSLAIEMEPEGGVSVACSVDRHAGGLLQQRNV